MTARFRRRYGAGLPHLLAHLGMFCIAGWAIDQIVGGGFVLDWLAWFLGAVLLHDLVLLPAYSVIGHGVAWVTRSRSGSGLGLGLGSDAGSGTRGAVNYVRVPAAIGGILLLVYSPLILGLSAGRYRSDTGHHLAGYTRNWLLVCAGLSLASALVWAIRRGRARARARS